jgi:hypothetical protein
MSNTPGKHLTGYDDFLDIVRKFRGLSVIALGTGVTVPFVAYLSGITPPWPPGVIFITGLLELLALIVVFQFLRNSSRRVTNRVIGIAAPMLICVSVLYLLLFAFFTYPIQAAQIRGVKGFVCQKELVRSFADACPFFNLDRLKDVGYSADVLWQSWSVDLMRFFLVITWLSAFLLLSTVVGSFIVFQTKVRPRQN